MKRKIIIGQRPLTEIEKLNRRVVELSSAQISFVSFACDGSLKPSVVNRQRCKKCKHMHFCKPSPRALRISKKWWIDCASDTQNRILKINKKIEKLKKDGQK